MSTPPPGYNEQASNLPDPGPAAAPIHMMRGGGAVGGDEGTVLPESVPIDRKSVV